MIIPKFFQVVCCSLAVEIAKKTSFLKRNGSHLLKMENYSCSRLSQEIRLEKTKTSQSVQSPLSHQRNV